MTKTKYMYPRAIVSTDWLVENINNPKLRIFDCTTHLDYCSNSDKPYNARCGYVDYINGHIPGSALIDLQKDLSDNKNQYLFAIPKMKELVVAFGKYGVDGDNHVILYARENPQWATRVWWMLHSIGFENVSILDGGFVKWKMESKPIRSENETYPPSKLMLLNKRNIFVDKDIVLDSFENTNICIVSALSPDIHNGENTRYGRAGRIPTSVNIPAVNLISKKTKEFISPQKAIKIFNSVGVLSSNKIINYCGSGIWASTNAFILYQLGYKNISIYDNSMSEWGRDHSLPIEI